MKESVLKLKFGKINRLKLEIKSTIDSIVKTWRKRIGYGKIRDFCTQHDFCYTTFCKITNLQIVPSLDYIVKVEKALRGE